MTGFRNTRGLPVIATGTAEEIGAIEHFVVRHGRIEAIHVGGGRRHPALLDWSDVRSFGDDAVMIDDETRLHEASGDVEEQAARGDLVMLDKRVLRDDGDELGTVGDVEFDPDDGCITGLVVDGTTLPGDRLRGVGTYAVVVTGTTRS